MNRNWLQKNTWIQKRKIKNRKKATLLLTSVMAGFEDAEFTYIWIPTHESIQIQCEDKQVAVVCDSQMKFDSTISVTVKCPLTGFTHFIEHWDLFDCTIKKHTSFLFAHGTYYILSSKDIKSINSKYF